jgi:quinol monooxygenase YgiN
MILNLIQMHTLPKKRKELVQTLLSLGGDVRQKKGCLSHHIYEDLENENIISILEEWETQNDLEAYLHSDLFGVLKGAMRLLNTSQQMKFNVVSQIDAQKVIGKAEGT